MSDNPKDDIPSRDRVSIRAVLVEDGEDPNAALFAAGIYDPVAIPVVFGETPSFPGGILGDGVTPNLAAVLETETLDEPETSTEPRRAQSATRTTRPAATSTTTLPQAYGIRPLAPVRKILR